MRRWSDKKMTSHLSFYDDVALRHEGRKSQSVNGVGPNHRLISITIVLDGDDVPRPELGQHNIPFLRQKAEVIQSVTFDVAILICGRFRYREKWFLSGQRNNHICSSSYRSFFSLHVSSQWYSYTVCAWDAK